MSQQVEAVYYHTGNVFAQDAMILAEGSSRGISKEDSEYWGFPISWEDVTGGEVTSIKISFDDGATWREATEKEFSQLEKEAQEEIDEEAFSEVWGEDY